MHATGRSELRRAADDIRDRYPSANVVFTRRPFDRQNPGSSNRESGGEERAERAAHPPVDTNPPALEDAAGCVGEQPTDDQNDRQTSRKAGSLSTAEGNNITVSRQSHAGVEEGAGRVREGTARLPEQERAAIAIGYFAIRRVAVRFAPRPLSGR
jgi:hypothetical protein